MTIVHIGKPFGAFLKSQTKASNRGVVLFKFIPSTTAEQKASFLSAIKSLKSLPCVLDNRLVVGGPSVTDPIEKSKGFEYALLSFHRDRDALEEYQASKEHEQ